MDANQYQKVMFEFKPQIAPVEAGPEPCLSYLIQHYYASHGCSPHEANLNALLYRDAFYREFVK